jgi:serine/threonine protein kinase
MKKALETTDIWKIILQDVEREYKFSDFYEYIEMLGCGGFGFVVSAIDLRTREKVALKVSPEIIFRLWKPTSVRVQWIYLK